MSDTRGEQRLWRAVLAQVFTDAFHETSTSYTSWPDIRTARAWLSRRHPDLVEVCEMAGRDPDATIEAYERGAVGETPLDGKRIARGKELMRRREEVADLVKRGFKTRQIAELLGVHLDTIRGDRKAMGVAAPASVKQGA